MLLLGSIKPESDPRLQHETLRDEQVVCGDELEGEFAIIAQRKGWLDLESIGSQTFEADHNVTPRAALRAAVGAVDADSGLDVPERAYQSTVERLDFEFTRAWALGELFPFELPPKPVEVSSNPSFCVQNCGVAHVATPKFSTLDKHRPMSERVVDRGLPSRWEWSAEPQSSVSRNSSLVNMLSETSQARRKREQRDAKLKRRKVHLV